MLVRFLCLKARNKYQLRVEALMTSIFPRLSYVVIQNDSNSRWDRYLGMTAAMTQLPVPTATQVQIKSEKITPMTSGLPTASCLCRSPRPSAMQRSLHPARRDHLKQLPRSRGLQRRKSGISRTGHTAGRSNHICEST